MSSSNGIFKKDVDEASFNKQWKCEYICPILNKIWLPLGSLWFVYYFEYVCLTSFADRFSAKWNNHKPNEFIRKELFKLF